MGVPIAPLGLLVAVETLPDIFRTVGNVTMDLAVTATVAARGAAAHLDEGDALHRRNAMKYRTLGDGLDGLRARPRLHADGRDIDTGMYGAADDDESIATIHRAIDLGVTFFDTAEVYGPYSNEELLGRGDQGQARRAGHRDQVRLHDRRRQCAAPIGSPANIRKVVRGSLQRLGIDMIDLFYQHRVDPDVPIEETVGAMASWSQEGKVRHIGLSEAGAEHAAPRRSGRIRSPRCRANIRCGSAMSRTKSCRCCRELGIGFVPYQPARPRFPDRADHAAATSSPRATSGATTRAIRTKISRAIWRSVDASSSKSPRGTA